MEIFRGINPKDFVRAGIRKAPYLAAMAMALATAGCGSEYGSDYSDKLIKGLQPGAQIKICDCEVTISGEANRRSKPRVTYPKSGENNIAYTGRIEKVVSPLIINEPRGPYNDSSETLWISYPDPRTGNLVYIVINESTDGFFYLKDVEKPGILDHYYRWVTVPVQRVDKVRFNGNVSPSITVVSRAGDPSPVARSEEVR